MEDAVIALQAPFPDHDFSRIGNRYGRDLTERLMTRNALFQPNALAIQTPGATGPDAFAEYPRR